MIDFVFRNVPDLRRYERISLTDTQIWTPNGTKLASAATGEKIPSKFLLVVIESGNARWLCTGDVPSVTDGAPLGASGSISLGQPNHGRFQLYAAGGAVVAHAFYGY